jgi:hypothetical protein
MYDVRIESKSPTCNVYFMRNDDGVTLDRHTDRTSLRVTEIYFDDKGHILQSGRNYGYLTL